MSDNWITLIPSKTEFLPARENQEAALRIFQSIAPEADEFELIRHEGIEFFDCGGNFEAVKCPKCHSEIDTNWWEEAMSEDYVSIKSLPKPESSFFSRFKRKHIKLMSCHQIEKARVFSSKITYCPVVSTRLRSILLSMNGRRHLGAVGSVR